jgi:hypothetical protein
MNSPVTPDAPRVRLVKTPPNPPINILPPPDFSRHYFNTSRTFIRPCTQHDTIHCPLFSHFISSVYFLLSVILFCLVFCYLVVCGCCTYLPTCCILIFCLLVRVLFHYVTISFHQLLPNTVVREKRRSREASR